jgi:hypothetical protein
MKHRVYIKDHLKETFANLGLGNVDHITVYRVEGEKYFFSAGSGKFSATKEEMADYCLQQ